MPSYLGEKKGTEDTDKSEKGVKLHCSQIKVLSQPPTHACALIKKNHYRCVNDV